MACFSAHLSPLCLLRITVCPFYQIKNILNVSSHFAHRNAALLPSSQVAVTGRILARDTGSQYRKRFRTNIFAELEILKVSQSHTLMISPKVTLRLSCFQRAYRIFPLINILQTIAMSHTTTRETDETGMNIRYRLSQVLAETVLTSFEGILWKQGNHIQIQFSCRLRDNLKVRIRSHFCSNHRFICFPLAGRHRQRSFSTYLPFPIYQTNLQFIGFTLRHTGKHGKIILFTNIQRDTVKSGID